jgi:hypothetical protein
MADKGFCVFDPLSMGMYIDAPEQIRFIRGLGIKH